jgi:hypothetical protein
MPPFLIIEPVKIGDRLYFPGEVVQLDGQAASLLLLGKIKPQSNDPIPAPSPDFGFGSAGVNFYFGTAPPENGTYDKGDRVFNVNPIDGSFDGWVCVASGTPGTWIGYGRIGTSGGSTELGVSLSASTTTGVVGVAITLTATAVVPNGRIIAKIEFYDGASKLGEKTSSPYTFNYTPSTPGSKQLTAKITDNTSAVNTSNVVVVVIASPVSTPGDAIARGLILLGFPVAI